MTPDLVLRKRIQMIKSLSKKLFELIYECKSILQKVFYLKQLEEPFSIQTCIFKNIVGGMKNNTRIRSFKFNSTCCNSIILIRGWCLLL